MYRINPAATLMECNRFVPPILKCLQGGRKPGAGSSNQIPAFGKILSACLLTIFVSSVCTEYYEPMKQGTSTASVTPHGEEARQRRLEP
jgi:hypothetical protein